MTTLGCTLVSLCVSLVLVEAYPVAKKLPLGRDDVLAGSDFLSVFMRRSEVADRPDSPFESHHLNSVELVRPFTQLADKYKISDIFKSTQYGYSIDEMPTEVEDFQTTTPNTVNPTLEAEVKTTTTQFTEPTTLEDLPTTLEYSADDKSILENQYLLSKTGDQTVKLEPNMQQVVTDKIEEKVISVRVSSSVARHSHRQVEMSTTRSSSEMTSRQGLEAENYVSTLVTQEQPTITAVQRSELGVEEAAHSQSETASPRDQTQFDRQEVEGKVQEVSLYNNEQQRKPGGKIPVFEIHFQTPPKDMVTGLSNREDRQSTIGARDPPYRKKEVRQLSHYGAPAESTGYHSRISSPTLDSSVHFYRDHARSRNYGGEINQQPSVVKQEVKQAQHDDSEQPYVEMKSPNYYQEPRDQVPKEEHTPIYQEEPRERIYGEPERVYGQPEANYEVDEAVSVITNGKAHGVQTPTSPPDSEQNKFGYVVEGRNFRKYRVEERTPDGFIVGEYGVVSHDDGSLRGVRYTADSTINPRLIYDTLVKFLSLQ